ncbi:unnamed protein product [Ostreobium quekettii]|uniref:Uncharacterized protein n=1 Tax=Ostreobium quekettii TaxID=121088 RepID=A0A8S1IKS7_9CHLO|nr:unnamed protein product [Ostreobium quekettii]|eukprot:evm.model.scf_57.18 EVM.evm.TU.scf_57.18   scf_57:143798-148895(-)
MAALWCSQCKQVLALAKDLRWFQDGSSDAVSLCSVPGTLLDSIEYKEPSLVGGKSKVQRKLHCKQCDEDIGARTKLGLCSGRDCFSYKKTVFVESQGKKFPGAKWKSVLQELCQAGVAELVSIAEGRPSATDPKVSIVLADPESLTDDTLQQLAKFELRDYQLEMTRVALKANSLICLPTGSGKTLIAAAVMHAMLRLNPQKMAVFVVNNVALVEQQARQLRQQIPHATVIAVHGQLEDEMEVRRAYKIARDRGADALVVTCGLLNGWLLSEDGMRMCDVCCLVLDEAHHATGNSDYVNLMKRFWMPLLEIYRPLVMGLTASPVDGTGDITDQKFSTQLDNLKTALQCRLCTPQNCSVYDHIALPTAYAVCAESPSHKDEHLREQIESYLKKLMLLAGNLHVTGLFDACDSATSNKMRSLLRKELKKSRSKIKELGPVANEQAAQQRDKCMKLQLILEHLQDVLEVFDVNEVVGWTNATQVLINLFEKIKEGQHGTASKEQKAKHDLLCPVFKTWHADLARDRPPQEIREAVVSSRCQELVKILKEFIETEEAGQAIVFVGMRKTAKKLTTFLATKCPDIGLKLHPEAVVGHGQAGADGMEFEGQQDQVLNNFRRGFTRLLVATCVLEEGIDIPKCSLVVRFDEDTPIRALIQSRGRARAKDGRLIVICTSSKRVELLCNTVNQEHLILEALRKEMKRTDIHGGCGELPEACAKQELEVNPDTAPRWRPPPSASGQEVSKYPEWGADFGQDDLICDLTFGHGEDGDTTSDDGCESGTDGADFVQLAFTGIFTRQMYPPEDTMKSRLHGICDVLHWNKIVLPVRDILGVIEHHDFWVRPPGCAEYADDQRKFEREFWQHYFSEGHDDVWLQIHKKPNLAGRAVRLQVAKFTLGSWYNHHEFIAGAELGSVLRLSLDHSEREIVIEVDEVFSVEFNFWEVQDFIVVHASPDLTDVALHLTLRHPPRLYKVLKAEGTNVETRNRLTEIKEASGKIVDSDCFAQCLTYRLQLANPENKEAPFTPNITKCLKLFHGVGKRIFFAIVRKVPSADGGQSWNAGISPKCKHHSDPEVNYAWCCIRSSSGFVAERFDDVFFEELSHVPGVVACECLYIMVHDLGRSLFGTPASLFKRARWTYFNRSTVDGISGEGHAKVRRMVLTPTRMVFFEPDTMQVGEWFKCKTVLNAMEYVY